MSRTFRLLFASALVLSALGLRWTRLDRALWNLDEGATFTMAQQVLAGDVLYRDAADNRSPLVPYLKAAILAVAGDWNAYAVHLVLAVMMGVCAICLWRIGRRLADEVTGVAAAIVFTVASYAMLEGPDAISANTGWCLVMFSTLGMTAFVAGLDRPRFGRGIVVGLQFGASFLCKQPGLFDFAAALVVLALTAWSAQAERRSLVRFAVGALVGAAIPVALFAAYFARHGALSDLVYYAYTFNTKLYIPEVPLLERLAGMRMPFVFAWQNIPSVAVLGVAAALVAIVTVARTAARTPRSFPVLPWLILGWTGAAILATGLSGRTFSHYSAQVVPPLSLACGWIVGRIAAWTRQPGHAAGWRWLALAGGLAVAVSLGASAVRQSRRLGPQDAAPVETGRTIAAFSSSSERVFVWGYVPEFYFFAQRLPASRFLYTNYVTGMIPWTNLDPLVDTAYAVPAEAWSQLTKDLQQRPPAVIVDTGSMRGYLKYPLHDQAPLWNRVRAEFAQVAVDQTAANGVRVFRRLDGAPAEPSSKLSDKADPRIQLSGHYAWLRNEPPRLRLRAPAGATRVELFQGDRQVASIAHPANLPVDVLFFAPARDGGTGLFRGRVAYAAGAQLSAPYDFATFAHAQMNGIPPGPKMPIGPMRLAPASLNAPVGAPSIADRASDVWRIDTPQEIAYDCPQGITTVRFSHRIDKAARDRSDGYDVSVDLVTDGTNRRLYERRLEHKDLWRDDALQSVQLEIPEARGGQLVFRFGPGKSNRPDFDWLYFGQLTTESRGPALRLGDTVSFPSRASMGNGATMRRQSAERWLAHAPTLIEWERPYNASAVTVSYGMEDGSFTAPNGHSDGVEIVFELIEPNGKVHPLLKRALTPFNHPEHRGPQSTRVDLPPTTDGRLVFRVDPGPQQDLSWDWAWVDTLVAEGVGPSIVGAQREIVPSRSTVVNAQGGPSTRNDAAHWGAHADATLVYERPAELRSVTFSYGLVAGADRDESGKQRSDGVELIVTFQPRTGPVVEVMRRALDPFHRPADLGEQTAKVELPRFEPGLLVFRLTPGPNGNNAFDWGFWGTFKGEFEP